MSTERGVLVKGVPAPVADGHLALRAAVQSDAQARPRRLALVDTAPRTFMDAWDAPALLRGSPAGDGGPVTTPDSEDLSQIGPGLRESRIIVGDGRLLVADVQHLANDGHVLLTPILFDASGELAVGMLASKAAGAAAGLTLQGWVPTARLSWPLQGPQVVGLHLTTITGTGNGVRVWGGVLPANTAAFPAPQPVSYVPLVNLNQGLAVPDWAQA